MAKVLIADDEDSVLRVLCRILALDGHATVEAHDGEEAIRKARSEHPDIALIDLFMPRKEGLETIIQLRKLFPELKLIAISGGNPMHGMSFLDMASRLGAHRTLAKPFSVEEIRNTIAELLKEEDQLTAGRESLGQLC